MLKEYDIIIIGAGPAGIFTALEFIKKDRDASILILDKGKEIKNRICPARTTNKCVSCNPCGITSGWSGAGAFSDGKLSLSHEVGGNITDYMEEEEAQELIHYVDQIYMEFGAQKEIHGLDDRRIDEIKYEASKHNIQLIPCPVRHLGTEKAFDVLGGMYHRLMENNNITFMELTEALDLIIEDDRVKGLKVKRKGQDQQILFAKYIIAAPGRGGAHWLSEQTQRLSIETVNNAVDIGVRVEVPNSIMDHLTKDLYEAKLVYFSDSYDNRVRTF